MNYSETLEFLFNSLPAYHRIGKAAYKNNLNNTIRLDEHLGHPHFLFKSIHVAGTNGKGSVSHMIASILQEAGFRTGLYTSPHLKDFRERIKINGTMIPEEAVVAFVHNNKGILEEIKPSFFEMTVAMAFDYFAREKVDYAVIEVGLGGRLDSTNIIIPLLSVITNIGHDHMDLLGDSLQKVATEKAGIIKEGIPVVIGETAESVRDVFIAKADTMHSVISFADTRFNCDLHEDKSMKGEREFIVTDKITGEKYNGVTLITGDYQSKNLVTVYGVIKTLNELPCLSNENIARGIQNVVKNTGLSGRWEILGRHPLIICDTGHNKEGLEYVAKQLKKLSYRKLRIVIGFVNDKDLSGVLPLLPRDAVYYFTKASVERALDENILKERAGMYGLKGNCYPVVRAAVQAAKNDSAEGDLIFIGGSTFIVGDSL